jgi:hypothetical protein
MGQRAKAVEDVQSIMPWLPLFSLPVDNPLTKRDVEVTWRLSTKRYTLHGL